MRKWTAYFVGISALLLWLTSGAQAAETFQFKPFEAKYSVKLGILKLGELKQIFYRQNDGNYVLATTSYSTGLLSLYKYRVEEQSVMRETDGTLQPLLYVYHATSGSKDVVERIDFDWAKGEARSLRDGKITVLPISKGLLDKQVYQLIARRDLAQGMTSMSYQLAERSHLSTKELKVVGNEDIVTPFGTFKTLKVQIGASTIWCAPDLDYAIVQLSREEDDHTVTSYITSLTPH